MSFNTFPYPGGPTPTQPAGKDLQCKVAKLLSSDFSTGGTTSLKIALPADASIVRFSLLVKTQLAGNSISAATVSVGLQGGSTTYFAPAQSAFGTAGTYTILNATANVMQDYQIPLGADLDLTVTGTATTGNPTSGEIWLMVEYVR